MAEIHSQAFLDFLPVPVMVMGAEMDIVYINPAFEYTFGWTLEEIRSRMSTFIPEDQMVKTTTGKYSLAKTGNLKNLETKRRAKDGRILDIIYDGATYFDTNDNPAGLIITLRDITLTKRAERTHQTLYRISTALHSHSALDDLLNFISHQTQALLGVGRAHVVLLDESQQLFYFRADAVEDAMLIADMGNRRFPIDYGIMGEVYRTGKPVITNDYASYPRAASGHGSEDFFTVNMAQVPIWVEKKMIGMLITVNKKDGGFNQEDVDLLSTIAGMVALPIENARINKQLHESYLEIKSLNKAKDCVIDRLSHEFRTPLSVISSSLYLLGRLPGLLQNEDAARILSRSRRNLNRLLDMQNQMEDIIQNPDAVMHKTLRELVEICSDHLESLVAEEAGEAAAQRIRQKFDQLLSPGETASAKKLLLGSFVEETLDRISPKFTHRRIELIRQIENNATVFIPAEVLEKIITGLVKNAVEYTPDGGRITVKVTCDHERALFSVADTGIGITSENSALIFENYFTTSATNQYATRKPYDFNAGGGGFDLLRIKLFSERYQYKINTTSRRCPFIPNEEDQCPGNTATCRHLDAPAQCYDNGGTTIVIEFPAETSAYRI